MGWARASWPVSGLVLEVQVLPKISVRAQIIKNGLNRVQNRRFGLKTWDERGNGKHIHDSALAAWANAVKASAVVSASSSSLDAAVATCILHADVAAAACLLWLLLVLLLLTLMVMTVVAVAMITSRAHCCAARSSDPSASPWGSKDLQGHRQRCALRHLMRCSSLFVKC